MTRRLASAVILAALVGTGAFALRDAVRADQRAFPAPSPLPPAPSFADFAGAAACAECHGAEYATWRGSTHGRAGAVDPADAAVLRPFDGRPIRFRDATVSPVRRGGSLSFVVRRDDGRSDTLAVAGTVGGGHMAGGGTQGFVTRHADGSLRFLPFELARRGDVWFCNTSTRLDGGWLPITPDMRLADCGDWPPVRALGEQTRLATCQNCHGSQIDVTPAPGQARATRLSGLAIDCESCHGPGRPHIEAARAGATGDALRMRSLATLGEDASNDVCFSCHALKDALRPGYLAGAPLGSFYSLLLPLLSDAPVHADGRIRTFAYQQQQLWSDCYLSGTMTCTDCHAPHGQTYRDVNGAPLAGRFDDGQCTSCHASKAVQPERHTMHAAGSAGSRCVACHMPYLQEPEVGGALRYARSDHTIPVPRPASDASLGIEVACAQCHADTSVETLQAQVRERWGELKPRRPIVQALLDAGTEPDRATLIRALEENASDPVPATFMALGLLLRDHLRADAGVDDELRGMLDRLADSMQPDVAAAALAALHWAAGNDRNVHDALADALERREELRRRWVVLLGFLGDRAREAGRPAEAVIAYTKALELEPRDAGVLANLGLAQMDGGAPADAIATFRRSIAADSMRALTHVNLGIALAGVGDAAGAERAYRSALRVDPHEPLAAFNLGNLYLRADRAADAIPAYRAAVAADPSLAAAWFNLARASVAAEDLRGAAAAIRAGLEFEPDNASARAFLEELEARGVGGGG